MIDGSPVFFGATLVAAPEAPASSATMTAPTATSAADPARLVRPMRCLPRCLVLILISCSFP